MKRPLSRKGRRQAAALAKDLRPLGAARVLSSPYLRCVETVEPLAAALGVEVELSEDLATGADLRALDLVRQAGAGAVLCTHGDVALDILNLLHRQGAIKGHVQSQKGSAWALELVGDQVVKGQYLLPSK